MSWVIAGFLFFLWILGMLTFESGGGWVHGLFLLGVLILAKRVVSGPPKPMGGKRDGVHRKFQKPWERGEEHD